MERSTFSEDHLVSFRIASADCGQIMANRNELDYFSFADQADRT
jgi:hypothetical protein